MTLTVEQAILNLKIEIKNRRIEELKKIDAPSNLINRLQDYVGIYKEGKQKVGGQVKHKDLMTAVVKESSTKEFLATYYKGDNNTTLLIMQTNLGVVFFDWYGNKIADKVYDLYFHKKNQIENIFENF